MSTAAFTPIAPMGNGPIPMGGARPLAASERVGRGQFATVSPSTGLAILNDGTVPGQISGGRCYPEFLSGTSTVAGSAVVELWQGWAACAESTIANDGFTDADYGVPFWIQDEAVAGKLSNSGGSNRSLGGLVFGVNSDGNPICWAGPVAALLARATLLTQEKIGAFYAHPVDGAASTTTAEKTIVRERLHGVVTAIYFDTMGTVAADPTDYMIVTVSKRDGAGGAAVVLGTYDSRAAGQGAIAAGVPKAFLLSVVAGALNLLETDIITYEIAKTGAGKILPVGTLRVVQKVN